MKERTLLFVALTLFVLVAQAQSEPKDVAREAFYAQTSGNYLHLSTLSHSEITSFFSMLCHELIKASDSDPTSNSMLESIFNTTDPREIQALGEQKIFARMYSHFFLSNLSPDERKLMEQAQFEYLETRGLDDTVAEVQYAISLGGDVVVNKKTMLLKKHGDDWLITMRPELLDVLRAVIDPMQ